MSLTARMSLVITGDKARGMCFVTITMKFVGKTIGLAGLELPPPLESPGNEHNVWRVGQISSARCGTPPNPNEQQRSDERNAGLGQKNAACAPRVASDWRTISKSIFMESLRRPGRRQPALNSPAMSSVTLS
jgi:hypothetical protein